MSVVRSGGDRRANPDAIQIPTWPLAVCFMAAVEERESTVNETAELVGMKMGYKRASCEAVLRRWLAKPTVDFDWADSLLAGLGRSSLWHDELAEYLPPPVPRVGLRCEDCDKAIEPDDYRPLDLFRVDPHSLEGWVWDSTKQKMVRRNARAGGRRFRRYDLCRRCAAEALRQRTAGYVIKNGPNAGKRNSGASVMENGVKRYASPRERLVPKRGGRPRLLTDAELRAAYTVYRSTGASMNALAVQLAETRAKGTKSGYQQAILYGWRRLGLTLRPKGEQIAISRHGTDGRLRPEKQRCTKNVRRGPRKGKRCRCWAQVGTTACWDHR